MVHNNKCANYIGTLVKTLRGFGVSLARGTIQRRV